jgi:uncharacterized protein YodC (DUF2158 family)
MAASFKVGERVKLTSVIPEGPVKTLSVNQDGDIQYLVEWQDADGANQEAWFKEEDLVKA